MPTNKKVIVIGIIIAMLLIVFGGYWYMQNQDTTTEPASTDTSGQMMEESDHMEGDSEMAMNDNDADDTVMMQSDVTTTMEKNNADSQGGKRSYPEFMIDSWATADPGQNYILTFNADGTYQVTLADAVEDHGTWYVQNNTSLALSRIQIQLTVQHLIP